MQVASGSTSGRGTREQWRKEVSWTLGITVVAETGSSMYWDDLTGKSPRVGYRPIQADARV